MNAAARPILIMAGGTGGHIFPGIAVGRELLARGVPVLWLGGSVGLEGRLVPAAGFPLHTLDFAGVRGKGLATLLRAPLRLWRAVRAARALLRRERPRAVLSMGGYAAAPGGLAARLERVPLLVHEQNRVAGMTNRLLAQLTRHVLAGFADALPGAEWVGNPVRAEIAALPAPGMRFARPAEPLRLLVLGGSQGARALNAGVPAALMGFDANSVDVLHQCGARHADATLAAYAEAGIGARVEPFIDDMAAAYVWADLVVCRAGALTLAELCAAGVGAVLVPFPGAVDDHQTRNAQVLVEAGAACLIFESNVPEGNVPEGEVFVARLSDALKALAADPARRLAMAEAARTLARPQAASVIADRCLEAAA